MPRKNAKHGKRSSRAPTRWVNLDSRFANAGATEVRRLSLAPNSITTSAAGFNGFRLQSSGVAAATEWAAYAARYLEFRVLSMRIHLYPLDAPTTSEYVSYVATDRSGGLAAVTSIAQAWALTNPRLVSSATTAPVIYEVRAIDLEDQLYMPTILPVQSFSIQVATFSNVVSVLTFGYAVEYLVEFKGPQ